MRPVHVAPPPEITTHAFSKRYPGPAATFSALNLQCHRMYAIQVMSPGIFNSPNSEKKKPKCERVKNLKSQTLGMRH